MQFKSEYDFQRLIRDNYEKFVPGDLLDPVNHSKLLLISDEMWTGYGNVDFLFLDQNAIPILVECKLCKNQEVKGGIVWQLLDYWASSRYAWNSKYLYDISILSHNYSQKRLLDSFNKLGLDISIEYFFELAEFNIKNGKAKLVYYVDKTPINLLITVHELTSYFKYSNLELFVFEFDEIKPKLMTLQMGQLPPKATVSDKDKKCIAFYANLEKFNKKDLFDELNRLLNSLEFNIKKYYDDDDGWCSYGFENVIQFYIKLDSKNQQIILELKDEHLDKIASLPRDILLSEKDIIINDKSTLDKLKEVFKQIKKQYANQASALDCQLR